MTYDKNIFGEDVPADYDAKASDFWQTPPSLYPQNCFDPCPINPQFDGLQIQWTGDAFVNPPYSQIASWIDKALRERTNCNSIIMLLPNWTDRSWFQRVKDCRIEFLPGRVKFLDPKTRMPKDSPAFGSMLVHIK